MKKNQVAPFDGTAYTEITNFELQLFSKDNHTGRSIFLPELIRYVLEHTSKPSFKVPIECQIVAGREFDRFSAQLPLLRPNDKYDSSIQQFFYDQHSKLGKDEVIRLDTQTIKSPSFHGELVDALKTISQDTFDAWAMERYKIELRKAMLRYANSNPLSVEDDFYNSLKTLTSHMETEKLTDPSQLIDYLNATMRQLDKMLEENKPSSFHRCLFFCLTLKNSFQPTYAYLHEKLAWLVKIANRALTVQHRLSLTNS